MNSKPQWNKGCLWKDSGVVHQALMSWSLYSLHMDLAQKLTEVGKSL